MTADQLLDYLRSYGDLPDPCRDGRLEKKLGVFVGLARGLSELSTCRRSSVGCVVVPLDLSAVLSIGYNGPPSGEDNSSCTGEEGSCRCVHAEANALVKLRDLRPSLLVTSLSPCLHCAGLIVNSSSVRAVGYLGEYRDLSGLVRIKAAGLVSAKMLGGAP